MSTANPLEEQIICSICFEVYRDPNLLRECLHTFCHPCIQQLERNGRVECPECRTVTLKRNIKRDFKIQGFIDEFNRQREDITCTASVTGQREEIGSKNCQICKKTNKGAKYSCKECQQFMCEECQTTHKGRTVCQTHTVNSIGQIFQDSETEIKKFIKDIERHKKDIHDESQTIDQDIEEIKKIEVRQIQEVEKYSKDCKDVMENEKRVKKLIKDVNANVIRSLQERKRLFNRSQDDIQAKLDFLEDLIKEQDMNALTDSMENIKLNIKESVEQIKTALPSPNIAQSPVHVQKGADLDIKGCIQVTIDGSFYGSQQVKLMLESLFSDLRNKLYVHSDEVDLGYFPRKLVEVNNEIWCGGHKFGGESCINVYNQQCHKVNTVSFTPHTLQGMLGFCLIPSEEVIVASYNDMHQLDIQGTYQVQLAQGFFADVCYHEGQLYALKCNKPELLVFNKNNNKWQLTRNIELSFANGSSHDKLCIHKTGLYISSRNNHCIFVYNFQGQLLQRADQGRSRLFVCDMRDILVADWTNCQIKLYSQQTGWIVVPVSGLIDNPRYTLVDSVGNIWVANEGQKMLKCVQQYIL